MRRALRVRNLTKVFDTPGGGSVTAVDQATFDLSPGTALGIIGDSGAGKSTLVHCLVRLVEPSGGEVRFGELDWLRLTGRELRRRRRLMQMIWQDPRLSLNPYLTVYQHVTEPIVIHETLPRKARRAAALEMLERVGLGAEYATRYPEQLSGGQRQRVAIARAAVLEPELMIADEPTTALDPPSREAVLRLLDELGPGSGRSLILVSHDLNAARMVCSEVMVMRGGRFIEGGATMEVLANPLHPVTQALVEAARPQGVGMPLQEHSGTCEVRHWTLEEPSKSEP